MNEEAFPHPPRETRLHGPKGPAAGVVEPEVPCGVPAGPPAPIVDETVVRVAQDHQVVEVGASPIRPVNEVVGVQPPLPLTSGEPATPVAVTQHAEELAGDRTAPAADPDRMVAL